MQRLWSPSLLLLLCCCFFGAGHANRVYVHPFYLFAAENVSCEPLKAQPDRPLDTLPVVALDINSLAPDSRDASDQDGPRQNSTQRTAVLAELMNALGLRLYQNLGKNKHGTNTLFSPVNVFGSLVTFSMGASMKTARMYQRMLGLGLDKDQADCVSLVDGHKVLKTMQSFNSRVDGGPKDEIMTRVWAFTRQDCRLSEDFVQGTQDYSDASFVRGVDFSGPQEAEKQVNNFVEKTSDGTVKDLFKDLSSDAKLLFFSSFSFKGNWRTAFQTSTQEFHVDDTTTVLVPFMTRTGRYSHVNDKGRRCTVVKVPLGAQTYMLLVLPDDGVSVHDIDGSGDARLLNEHIFGWTQTFEEGLLELSLPKATVSMSTVTDLRGLLNVMNAETEMFGSEAEFDRLSNTKPFTIDKALYKVSVEMSEAGAEQQENNQEAGIPLKLSINRPFFFTVIEEPSNVILMLGKITNPSL